MGCGGHASVLVDILMQQKRDIVAVFSPTKPEKDNKLLNFPYYKNDSDLEDFNYENHVLVNGIGMLPFSKIRENLINSDFTKNFYFEEVISNNSYISPFAQIGEGVQIMPGAIIHPGATIGDHSIINTNAVIEHDCVIGKLNHIAPGAILCGQVKTSSNVFIGAGATLRHDINIGENSVIGAGSVILKNVPNGVLVKPSKPIITEEIK